MDPTEFETWLGEVSALTEPQRRRAWQALALSETADGGEIETRQLVDCGFGHAEDEPPASGASGPPLGAPSPDGNTRRLRFSSARKHAFVAIRYSHVRSEARPSKLS